MTTNAQPTHIERSAFAHIVDLHDEFAHEADTGRHANTRARSEFEVAMVLQAVREHLDYLGDTGPRSQDAEAAFRWVTAVLATRPTKVNPVRAV